MKNIRLQPLIGIILLLVISSAFVFLYSPLIGNWFISDDTYLMWASASLKLHEMFFSPERHRLLSSNFNPMYGVSLKIDWLLFNMNPVGYAVHNILSLSAVSVVLYFFIRLYTARLSALVGVSLFLLHPVTLHMTGLFFRKHYIEGLFWALLGLYFFVRADRMGRASVLSAFFYLIASLYREVYVVLPAVAFLISKQNMTAKRLRNTLPLWAGLLIYTLWRLWIREGMGGYPSNQPLFSFETLRFIPKVIASLSLQWSSAYPGLVYILMAVLIISSLKYPRLLFCFLILLIPILPVSNIIAGDLSASKYFFHLTVFLIICISLLIDKPPIKQTMLFRFVLLSLCLFFSAGFIVRDIHMVDDMLDESRKAKSTAMEFMYSGAPYIRAQQPSWFYEGLRNINRDFLGKHIQTQLIPPDDFLPYTDPMKLREIRTSGINIPYHEILEIQKKFKKGPINIKLHVDNYKLSWDFGPHRDKTYTLLRSLVSGLYYNKSDLISSGTYMLGKGDTDGTPEAVFIRVLYHTGNGEIVISPEFKLMVPSNKTIDYIEAAG
jgi:hypothetical protein